jgi:glycosyltransferase 2 family protein
MEKIKKIIKVLAGFLISYFFIYLVSRKMNFKEVLFYLKNVKIFWLIIFLFMINFIYILKGYRLTLLTLDEKFSIKKITCFAKNMIIGFMLNNILPFRMGDMIRGFLISKSYDIKKTFIIGTIVLERLFDLLTIFILLSLFLLTTHLEIPSFMRNLSSFGLIAICIIFFILIYFKKYKAIIIRKINMLHDIRLFRKLSRLFNSLLDGFAILDQSHHTLKIIVLSICIWFLDGLTFFVIGKALSLDLHIISFLFVMIISCLSTLIPSGPFFIGTFEGACVFAFAIFSVDQEQAMAFAVLFHSLQIVFLTSLGIIFSFKSKVDIFSLFKVEDFKKFIN